MEYKLIKEVRDDLSILEQLLYNRDIPKSDYDVFLDPLLAKEWDFHLLDHNTTAARVVAQTIARQEPIYIQVDSDCDGYTSAAVLINYLHSIFPAYIENNLTYGLHHKKVHGIDVDNIPVGTKLVIAPDASSNENDIHKKLIAKGIQVVVLDHHDAERDNTDCAVIVNNQMCDYPNKFLSGVGIVYKFCQAFDALLNINRADNYLDLVALGLLGDMMDQREPETRKLIALGLDKVHNPFFYYMCQKNAFSMNNTIDAHGVTWFVVPYINAVTRVGTDAEKELVFKSMLQHEAGKIVPSTKRGASVNDTELLVEQAIRICANIKRHQDDEKKNILNFLKYKIETEHLADYPIIIIQNENIKDEDPLRGITGLLANAVMSDYGKPTIIVNETIDKETGEVFYSGSARGFETAGVRDWRQFIEDSGYAKLAQGHPFAFGIAFDGDNLEKFKQYLIDKFGTSKFEKTYYVDYIWRFNEHIDTKIKEIAAHKNLWGQNAPEPLIVIEDIPVTKENTSFMSKGTIKIEPTTEYNCLKFAVPLEDYESLIGNRVTLVGTCAINDFRGKQTPQIRIVDYMIENILPSWSVADKPSSWSVMDF